MSYTATLYPDADTKFEVGLQDHVGPRTGRAYVRIDVQRLAIQANSWEEMQLLVDALSLAISRAKQTEQDVKLAEHTAATQARILNLAEASQ